MHVWVISALKLIIYFEFKFKCIFNYTANSGSPSRKFITKTPSGFSKGNCFLLFFLPLSLVFFLFLLCLVHSVVESLRLLLSPLYCLWYIHSLPLVSHKSSHLMYLWMIAMHYVIVSSKIFQCSLVHTR